MKKIILTIFLMSALSFASMEKAQINLAEYQAQKTATNLIADIYKKADALINSLIEVIAERDKEIKELKEEKEEE